MVVSSTMICIIVVVHNFAVKPRHICYEDASMKTCCRQCETINLCVLSLFQDLKPYKTLLKLKTSPTCLKFYAILI